MTTNEEAEREWARQFFAPGPRAEIPENLTVEMLLSIKSRLMDVRPNAIAVSRDVLDLCAERLGREPVTDYDLIEALFGRNLRP